LADDAERDGVRIIRILTERRVDGMERFDRPGESILVASADDTVMVSSLGGTWSFPFVTSVECSPPTTGHPESVQIALPLVCASVTGAAGSGRWR
jgi:hypothetical protein